MNILKRVRHYFIGFIAFLFLPCFWLGFNIFPPYHIRITVSELYNEWWIQIKSNKPWGAFDNGL